MRRVRGVISAKLARIFGQHEGGYPAARPPDELPMPSKGVEGIEISPAGRRRKVRDDG